MPFRFFFVESRQVGSMDVYVMNRRRWEIKRNRPSLDYPGEKRGKGVVYIRSRQCKGFESQLSASVYIYERALKRGIGM